jgi:protein-S-isoprenylcysteine O-methyltransferase Ste14
MWKEHILLGIGWSVFCVLHSVLADTGVKKKLADTYPNGFTYYRLFYTLFAFVTLIAVALYQVRITSPFVFPSTIETEVIGWITAVAGLAIMAICIKKYFLSLSGLKSLFARQVVANELRIDGIHRFVRHPLYLGTFIFIWGAWVVYPYLSLLIANIIITAYTLLGIIFEEKNWCLNLETHTASI